MLFSKRTMLKCRQRQTKWRNWLPNSFHFPASIADGETAHVIGGGFKEVETSSRSRHLTWALNLASEIRRSEVLRWSPVAIALLMAEERIKNKKKDDEKPDLHDTILYYSQNRNSTWAQDVSRASDKWITGRRARRWSSEDVSAG